MCGKAETEHTKCWVDGSNDRELDRSWMICFHTSFHLIHLICSDDHNLLCDSGLVFVAEPMQPAFDPVLEESQQAAMKQFPVPEFGQTRCYWSLLDSDLRYLYLDPTCFVHMGDQAQAIIGTCLLDYVHPDEQHSARADLGNVLASRTLHGSVTRVRYARLSRIRAILGCNAPESFPDAHIVTVDEHYIACDVVINWVSDNVVLCFLHAIVDKGKADNDELNKTHWTNWCGTSAMTTDHAAGLFDRLRRLVPPSSTPPDRIFQILINQPARPILFSWPPEGYTAGEFGKLVHRMQIGPSGDNHPRSEDGAKTSCTRRYKANQRIVEGGVLKDVESIFIPHGAVIFACHKVVASYSDMQRSDMYHNYQRQPGSHYPAQPHQQSLGQYDSEVRRGVSDAEYSASGVPESPEYAHSRVATSGYQRGPAEYGGPQYARNGDYAHGPYVQQPYPGPYPIPPNQQRNHVYAPAPPHSHPDHRGNEGWGYSQQQPPAQPPWPASNPRTTSPRPAAGYEGGPSWMAAQGWTQGPVEQAPPQQHPQPQPGYSYPSSQQFGPPPVPAQQQQPLSPPPPYAPNTPVSQPPTHLEPPPQAKRDPSPADEETTIPRVHAPPKRKRESIPKRELNDTPDLAHADGEGPGHLQPSPPSKDVIARERGHSTGMTIPRAGGAPPPGVLRCSSCKNETSPEWRKGPSGKKDLCNACGLRYARSKQKKDGAGAPKRRRDKEVPLAPAPAPTAPPLSLRPAPMAPSSSSSTAPPWPNPNPSQPPEGRVPKRQRSGTLNGTLSPSPPQSQPSSYDGQYGQPVYPHGYNNGYGIEYARMPQYAAPEVASDDRTYAGQ